MEGKIMKKEIIKQHAYQFLIAAIIGLIVAVFIAGRVAAIATLFVLFIWAMILSIKAHRTPLETAYQLRSTKQEEVDKLVDKVKDMEDRE